MPWALAFFVVDLDSEEVVLMLVDAVVTGTLVERDGGIDLDFTSMVLPEDLTR